MASVIISLLVLLPDVGLILLAGTRWPWALGLVLVQIFFLVIAGRASEKASFGP
jgi:hypothetical protein